GRAPRQRRTPQSGRSRESAPRKHLRAGDCGRRLRLVRRRQRDPPPKRRPAPRSRRSPRRPLPTDRISSSSLNFAPASSRDALHLARPRRPLPQVIQRLTRLGHHQNAFVLAVRIVGGINRRGIAIAKVDLSAYFPGNSGGQRYPYAIALNAIVVSANTAHVRRVREYAPRHGAELIPLLTEVVAAVIADLSDEAAVSIRNLANMRSVDNHFATVGDYRFELVHAFAR